MMHRKSIFLVVLLLFIVAQLKATEVSKPLTNFVGSDFSGGAKDKFSWVVDGEGVNIVYAEPTGKQSMQVKFSLALIPTTPLFLHVKGRDDDAPSQSRISIELNDVTLFSGNNGFSSAKFETRTFTIPAGGLKEGENVLTISCREKSGRLGMPPWFQISACAIAPENFALLPDLKRDFSVMLPIEKRPFPEPLALGEKPGFKFRGIKGWAWKPEQYLAEIPYLEKFKMNFLMNCYISMFDIEHHSWSKGDANRWWEDFPTEKKKAYEKIVRECQGRGIEFCFSMNPNLYSKRTVNDGSRESIDQFYKHYAWMQSLGVKWFNISLDDATQGIDASTQAKVVNEIFSRLRAKDPAAQMIFCPTFYWGDGTLKNPLKTGQDQQSYLKTLAAELNGDVYLFWVGDGVVGKITVEAARSFRRISGHRLFLWDNYPVNDDKPAMHLGPVIDRDADLCDVIEGYISNPHCKQNEINRIPLATCADYAYNPHAYDPRRSIGQAIFELGDSVPRREVLRDLVELYPGMLICSPQKGPGFNAVQEQFDRILAAPHSRPPALSYIEHVEMVNERLRKEFPAAYQAEQATLQNDVKIMRGKLSSKYP